MQRVRVYIACSFDGFIAGPDDDLSWLPGATAESESPALDDTEALDFEAFMADVGSLLMGRGTYDVVAGFEGPWPYGERPVLVATHRPLEPPNEHVRGCEGDIVQLVEQALSIADGKDVYIDGGVMIRQALDAGLVDELVVTMVPILLGEGHALFAGLSRRHQFEFVAHHDFGELMQVILRRKT